MVSKSNEFRRDQTHQRFSYLKTVTQVVIRPSMVTQNKTWRFSKRVKKDNYNVWRNSTFGSTSTRRSKKSSLILFPLLTEVRGRGSDMTFYCAESKCQV